MKNIRNRTKEFKLGQKAYHAGKNWTDNPFRYGSDRYELWNDGFQYELLTDSEPNNNSPKYPANDNDPVAWEQYKEAMNRRYRPKPAP